MSAEVEYPYCAFCETPLSEHPEPLCSPGTVRDLRAELAEARREHTQPDDMDLRDMIGPRLEAAQVRDADGVAALAVDVISPVLERLRAERDALKAAIERARRMAQVWIDIRPDYPTATREGHVMADAGQQILAALDGDS